MKYINMLKITANDIQTTVHIADSFIEGACGVLLNMPKSSANKDTISIKNNIHDG